MAHSATENMLLAQKWQNTTMEDSNLCNFMADYSF